jgi:hypothetical protein
MKKLMLSMMTACMLLSIFPVQLHASTEPHAVPLPAGNAPATAETTVMLARLNEIRAMDISTMAKAEKQQLREEVRAIKKDMRAANDGVYLSVGAIIVIILLLILIL